MSNSKMLILILVAALSFGTAKTANAQSADIYFDIGTAIDKSNGQSPDFFGTGNPAQTPKMTGLFGGIGGSFMFRPNIGFGAEFFSRFSQGGYAELNYRPRFYDFNAVWMPIRSKYVAPEFQGGIGGVSLTFYLPPQCNATLGCSSSSYITSSRHFQTHLGMGVNFYLKNGVFFRPQADVHYVRNFSQFGSNWVPAYSIAIGYSFGRS